MPSRRKSSFWSLLPLLSGWVSCRLSLLLSLLCTEMPASLMSLTLWPSWSLSLVPSLAPSWSGPCLILWLVWKMTSCSARCGLSAFIWTVSLLCLLFAVDFSCLLVALHVLSRRTPSPSSYVTCFLMLGLLGLRWVASGLTTSAVCPPRSPFTVTGRSPRFWSRPLGPPVRCLRHFIYATFNTSSMASFLWVRL